MREASPRLLVALPQFPRDPASGAARTANTVGELMAQAGFRVETVATTATEGYVPFEPTWYEAFSPIDELGVRHFVSRGVKHALLDTGDFAVARWGERYGPAYDALFDRTLERFRPDLILTFGGSPADVARQRRARAAGSRVVFGLYNTGYCTRGLLDHVNAVITPSEFLSRFYWDAIRLRSTTLVGPLWPEDVVVTDPSPTSLTIVNPSLDKGLIFFASLVAALGSTNPEIPIDVYPSRDNPRFLLQTPLVAGIDLSEHANLVIHPIQATPAAIFRRARVILVPSLVEDAAPRVVSEALVNGIPPIGSDRGGIPEMCADGGFVLPVPRSFGPNTLSSPASAVLRPWADLIRQLFQDDDVWRRASERARHAGARYLPPAITRMYAEFFERLLADGRVSAST